MVSKQIAACTLAACISALAMAAAEAAEPDLTAAQIVEKNVAARGGLEAWRKIQTMAWVGHVESPTSGAPAMTFFLEMQRPNRTRFELNAFNQISVRVFDGSHGWKIRPARNGKPDLQPYTMEELKFAHDEQVIDGPLIDYQAKGVNVSLDGVDEVEGRKAYRLNVRLPSGAGHHVWIDAQSFLDIKYDRESRNAIGQPATVSVFYRDFRSVEGLQIPFTIETSGSIVKATNKLVIEKIALNPPLGERTFARPGISSRRNTVTIGAEVPQPPGAVRPAK